MNQTMTPKQLETHLKNNISSLKFEDLPSYKEAKASYAKVRHELGFKLAPGQFLSTEEDITKLDMGSGRYTLGLSLPPATSSDIANLCAFEDQCAEKCVGTGGSNRFTTASNGKLARLKLLVEDTPAAIAMIVYGIESKVKVHTQEGVGVRLNVYSDLRWERVLPTWFWKRFANVVFYDYTKHPLSSRPVSSLPDNYKLTYSVSQRSTVQQISIQRKAGRSVAVVVETRGGKIPNTKDYRPFSVEVDGVSVIDGDANDRRYLDEPGSVVLLRRKNGLPKSNPLVRDDQQLLAIVNN